MRIKDSEMDDDEGKALFVSMKAGSRETRENLKLFLQVNKPAGEAELKTILEDRFMTQVNSDRPVKVETGSNIEKAYGLVYDAIEYLNRHMDEQGMELVERALELDPDNEEALKIKLDILGYRKQHMEAGAIADKIISMECLSPFIYANAYWAKSQIVLEKAYEQESRKLAEEALHFAEKGLGIEEENYDLIMLKAGILYQLGRREYQKWINKARMLDRKRTDMFMEHYWIREKLI